MFSHLPQMAIIAESATVVRNDCIVWNGDAHTVERLLHTNGTGVFYLMPTVVKYLLKRAQNVPFIGD